MKIFDNIFKGPFTKWEHVMFVEDWRAGTKTYEIFRRNCLKTGIVQYRCVYVSQCVHGLVGKLSGWINSISKTV